MKHFRTIILLLILTSCYHDNIVVDVKSGNTIVLNGGKVIVLTNVKNTRDNYSYLMDNVIGTQVYMIVNSRLTKDYVEIENAIVYNSKHQCINEILGGKISGIKPAGINEKPENSSSTSSSSETDSNDIHPRVHPSRILSSTEIFKQCSPAVFKIYTSSGDKGFQGSGFFVSFDGIGVSNYHVFEGTNLNNARIILSDKSVYSVNKILQADSDEDFIIFQVDISQRVPFINISNSIPVVGEQIYTIGSPYNLDNTFSSGEISQIRDNGNLYQINAPIDHGSSGGVLLNNKGEAIGITTSGLASSGANLNFAININLIKRYVLR